MKTLIFHDHMSCIGGAERASLTLARELGADIAACDLDKDAVCLMGFDDIDIMNLGTTSNASPLRQIRASIRFSRSFFPGYDIYVFCGSYSHHASLRHKPNIWYCHSPARAFYDLRKYHARRIGPINSVPFGIWVFIHGFFYRRAVAHVQETVANSHNIRHRIKKHLGTDSKVIYPPVDTKRYKRGPSGDYWLSVNRIYPEKRVDLQIEAFRRMPQERLLIVGSSTGKASPSEYEKSLMKNLPENVTMKGSICDTELIDLYAGCRGFITTAMDEDFGLTPVEAMASGKPVIATAEGGHLETVTDETGALIEASQDALIRAVNDIGPKAANFEKACLENSKRFDTKAFVKAFKAIINQQSIF